MSRDDALARIRAKARIKSPRARDDRAARLPKPSETPEPQARPLTAEVPQDLGEILPPTIATAIAQHFPGRILEIRSPDHAETHD